MAGCLAVIAIIAGLILCLLTPLTGISLLPGLMLIGGGISIIVSKGKE